jgi:hypothetical protein
MRRIDAIAIAFGVFIAGGIFYGALQLGGLDATKAGIWSQVMLVAVVIGWVSTYLFRVSTKNMSYHQQFRDYEESFFQKKLEELSPEELAKLQAEVEAENQ